MSEIVRIDPATLPPEEVERLNRLATEQKPIVTGRHCAACNKMLEDPDLDIIGYASGMPLGLCRKCASYVNTPGAIYRAEALGHEVKCRPTYAPPAKQAGKGEVDEWEG